MASKIRPTPTLYGKDAERFLEEMEKNKEKKATPEEKKRITDLADQIIGQIRTSEGWVKREKILGDMLRNGRINDVVFDEYMNKEI